MAEAQKVICIGLNYHDHALEQGAELPEEPLLFGKFASAIIGPGDSIVLPPESAHVDAEAELAVVIGAEGRRVSEADSLELVAGYTVANDVTARDLQKSDGQWLRAKGFDTFCPVLPVVVPVSELGDGSGLRIVQRLNGEALQDSSTAQMIFSVAEIIAYTSQIITLEPGDLIATGTPAGVGVFRDPKVLLKDGDEVSVEIEGLGTLTNPFIKES